jgi:hypothetical protein
MLAEWLNQTDARGSLIVKLKESFSFGTHKGKMKVKFSLHLIT